MPDRPAVTSANAWIIAVVLVAIAMGVFALVRIDRSGEQGSGLGDAFEYSIDEYKTIDPALIGYERTLQFATDFSQARAVAVGLDDRIHVAGDQAIRVFEPNGTFLREITLSDSPRCLTVAGENHVHPGRIYVGMDRHVEVLDGEGQPVETWENLMGNALLTSIAATDTDIFTADAGNRTVVRYDPSGQRLGRLGTWDERTKTSGFSIPSPFFDIAAGPDGLMHVVNPGIQRIESYSPDGDLEHFWGEASAEIEGFFGCCNPAHFAMLPDGRFVTAEKGLLRVKIYSPDGEFECVVAGPDAFDAPGGEPDGASSRDREFTAVDVAADRQGRVVVLDLATADVRVFVLKPSKLSEPSESPALGVE